MSSSLSSSSATWLGYPEPADTSSIPRITAAEAARILRDEQGSSARTLLLIDVRRSDLTGHTIRGALNLPAHSFYATRETIARTLSSSASPSRIALFCGSSQGRGPRCAGWLRDALGALGEQGQGKEVLVLQGGIKGFLAEYEGDEELVMRLPDEVKES